MKEWMETLATSSQVSDFIVGGDMNSAPMFSSVKLLTQMLGSGTPSMTTFPLPFGLGITIDYLFVKGDRVNRIGGIQVLQKDEASDHFPIVTEVEVMERLASNAY